MRVRSELQLRFVNKHRGRPRRRYRRKRSTPSRNVGQTMVRHEKGAKSRMPQWAALARARLRRYDTFDARLSNKLSTLWHSPRNRASIYDRCREDTAGRANGYAGYGEEYGGMPNISMRSSSFTHFAMPVENSDPLKGKSSIRVSIRVSLTFTSSLSLRQLTHLETYVTLSETHISIES